MLADYVDAVKTFLDTTAELDHLLTLQANYHPGESLRLSLFSYLLDSPSDRVSARDNITHAGRLSGEHRGWSYAVDFALQEEYRDADRDGGTMFNAFLSRRLWGRTPGLGYSLIEGRDGDDRPFDTLFSTAHKFNGWTDQFVATDGGGLTPGLEEWYLHLGTRFGSLRLLGRCHWFEEETGGDDYGSELAALARMPLGERLNGVLKYASYDADNENRSGFAGRDEDVLWARLTLRLWE